MDMKQFLTLTKLLKFDDESSKALAKVEAKRAIENYLRGINSLFEFHIDSVEKQL